VRDFRRTFPAPEYLNNSDPVMAKERIPEITGMDSLRVHQHV
jgi:hypothetical protein